MNQMRQGDVWIEQAVELPPGLRTVARDERGRLILARGEVTGHAHAIHESGVTMYEDESGTLWLQVDEPAAVRHEEHAAITLAPGVYRSRTQESWTQGFMRQVAD